MKILIFGGDGMLGHQLLQSLQKNHEVKVTLRQSVEAYQKHQLFNETNSYFNLDILHDDWEVILKKFQPEAVINAIGIVKQRKDAKDSIPSIQINALFPHLLAEACKKINARMIHMSTDCVFSGKKGNYLESDLSDAEDLYGKTKYLGEVHEQHCVTIRSSIIGLELSRKSSLIEWFLAQSGTIKGFLHAIYSGLTTLEMSRLIENILLNQPELHGLWQVSSAETIDKYRLLKIFSRVLKRDDIEILPDDVFKCDRSLNGDNFYQKTGYRSPSWETMLTELALQYQQKEMLCSA